MCFRVGQNFKSFLLCFNFACTGGQKQRLSWGRLFFHSPKFALLDEATSAISADYVSKLFELAKKKGITLFTISHSPEVDKHHKTALDLRKGGKYQLSNV